MTATEHFPPLATASCFGLLLQCGGSATMRQVRDREAVAAAAGTAQHVELLRPGCLPDEVKDWFGGVDPAFEVALGADCGTEAADYFGRDLARAYPPRPGPLWVAGTADMIRLDGRVLSVGDLKTGAGQARGDLPVPEESPQLLGLAWLACRYVRWRRPGWTPQRVRLMWWYTAGGLAGDVEDAEVSWPALRDWGERLRQAAVSAWTLRGREVLRRGSHCGGCGGRDACPAYGGAVGRVAGVASDGCPDYGAAYQDLLAAERACDLARAAIAAEVERRGPLACGDHAVRLVRGSDSRISVEEARRVLGDRFGACAEVRISQGSIERGLGDAAASAIDELRAAGAMQQQPKAPYLRLGRARR